MDQMEKQVRANKFAAFDDLIEKIVNDANYSAGAAAVAILLILLTFVLLRLISSPASRAKKVLLIGISESGKTAMLTRLVSAGKVRTVTSMEPNEATVRLGNRSVTLVDLPGFDRLRNKFFDDYKSSARAIVLVLDSLSFVSNNRNVADFVYTVLSDPVVVQRRIPLLIACNKQDEAKAKSAKVLQKQLEKEVHAIRETRAAALDSIIDRDSDVLLIGNANREFRWSDVNNRVEFVDCSCQASDEMLDAVRDWIVSM